MPKHKLAGERGEPKRKRHRNDESSPLPLQIQLSPLLVEPWKAADIPSHLPPLPEIGDADIERQVYKHPGYFGDGPSYERLEWLGDAYLEMIATSLIFQTFTHTPSGRCSQMRERLIRNTTLAGYFRDYGMTPQAMIPPDISASLRNARGRSNDKDLIKIQGDMFEAYVAGVVVSDPTNGLGVAARWLRALFSITIKDDIIGNEEFLCRSASERAPATSHTFPMGAGNPIGLSTGASSTFPPKDQLTRLIGAKGVSIAYRDIPGPEKDDKLGLPLYTIGVFLTGWGERDKMLGKGTAAGKKEAGQIAAAFVLDQKDLMLKYQLQKRAYHESQNLAKSSESST